MWRRLRRVNIGQAAIRSGISAKMIRHYEDTGVIPRAERTASGYRAYQAADVDRLRFIRRARDLGFSMAETRDLLALWSDRARHSHDVKQLAARHLEDLQDRIRNLQSMAEVLRTLVNCCGGDDRPECPILDDLGDVGRARRGTSDRPA